jgi:CheY-like chemotaxis protein
VNGDGSRLQQVIWNLVSNAVKFTPDGGHVRVGIESDEHRSATIQVSDDGIGISRDFLPYVFDRFRQADSSAARSAGGLGLGLAIVNHIVEIHGGMVTVDSPGPGRGSTFTVCLPLAGQQPASHGVSSRDLDEGAATGARVSAKPALVEAATADAGDVAASEGATASVLPPDVSPMAGPASAVVQPTAQRDDAQRPLAGLHCLLVDDDADTRFLLRVGLEGYGARVTVASSAREAIEHVGEADILLADLAMPGEDGYSMIRRIRARGALGGATVPAIALTAHASEVYRKQALAAGFQEHLVKPIDRERVVEAIQQLLKTTGSTAAR